MPHSLYLHVPFCAHRCAYCDFNTYAGQESSIPAYAAALAREVKFVGLGAPRRLALHTVYFGGGTPSLLSPEQFRPILEAVGDNFDVDEDAEVTLEANPGTVSTDFLQRLRGLGINRISLGVQSANGEELRLLERGHRYLEVLQAASDARRAGFDNLSVDLIYDLPEQTLLTWQTTVMRILELRPEHISAYALTLEHGAPFGRWSARGLIPVPNSDVAADMYEWLSLVLEAAGYSQYEISNWARAGLECRHNLQYWRGLPYLGLGAGAHGYASGYRYSNVLRIRTYLERLDPDHRPAAGSGSGSGAGLPFPLSPAAVNHHRQSSEDEMAEFMIMGLRLTRDGVSAREFRERFGVDLHARYGREITDLQALGLLEGVTPPDRNESLDGPRSSAYADRQRLTRRGRLLGNRVFVRFVS
jgi:oxygen-independent coproporphyrinogen-3 oxidase